MIVDLKYDNCNVPSNWTDACEACSYYTARPYNNGTCVDDEDTHYCPEGTDFSTLNTAKRYGIMRDALLAQNRTMLYSQCDWGYAGVQQWGNATGSSWRMSTDIGRQYYLDIPTAKGVPHRELESNISRGQQHGSTGYSKSST